MSCYSFRSACPSNLRCARSISFSALQAHLRIPLHCPCLEKPWEACGQAGGLRLSVLSVMSCSLNTQQEHTYLKSSALLWAQWSAWLACRSSSRQRHLCGGHPPPRILWPAALSRSAASGRASGLRSSALSRSLLLARRSRPPPPTVPSAAPRDAGIKSALTARSWSAQASSRSTWAGFCFWGAGA